MHCRALEFVSRPNYHTYAYLLEASNTQIWYKVADPRGHITFRPRPMITA